MATTERLQQPAWKLVSTMSGVIGTMVARKLLQSLWPAADDEPGPPFNPADRRVRWTTALEWAIAAGVGAGVARLVGERLAAAGWERATGSPPPGVST